MATHEWAQQRLTAKQRTVLRALWDSPTMTLDEATRHYNVPHSIVRKWMADKEFSDWWEDCGRWRRVRVREQLEQGLTATAARLRGLAADGAPGPAAGPDLIELANRLIVAADQLAGLEREASSLPIRAMGWSERVGMPGRPIGGRPAAASPAPVDPASPADRLTAGFPPLPTIPKGEPIWPGERGAAPAGPAAPAPPAGGPGGSAAAGVRAPRTLTREEFRALMDRCRRDD